MTSIPALIIERKGERVQQLEGYLADEFKTVTFDAINSLHAALEYHGTAEYSLCVIGDGFDGKELSDFFSDMRSIGRDKICVFAQLRDNVPDNYDRSLLRAAGFHTVVSVRGTKADRKAFREALEPVLRRAEIHRRSLDIDEATKIVLREVDKVASDRKRGFSRRVARDSMGLVGMHANFDASLLGAYFQTLERLTGDAKPVLVTRLNVPDSVMRRNLPELDSSGYRGASSRVWDMLKQKHGVKPEAAAPKSDSDSEKE